MSDFLQSSQDGSVLTLTLNKPDRLNALDAALGKEVYDALKKADNDSSVRVEKGV